MQIAWTIVPLRHFFPLKVVPLIEIFLYALSAPQERQGSTPQLPVNSYMCNSFQDGSGCLIPPADPFSPTKFTLHQTAGVILVTLGFRVPCDDLLRPHPSVAHCPRMPPLLSFHLVSGMFLSSYVKFQVGKFVEHTSSCSLYPGCPPC
jgi:hypothetical protein